MKFTFKTFLVASTGLHLFSIPVLAGELFTEKDPIHLTICLSRSRTAYHASDHSQDTIMQPAASRTTARSTAAASGTVAPRTALTESLTIPAAPGNDSRSTAGISATFRHIASRFCNLRDRDDFVAFLFLAWMLNETTPEMETTATPRNSPAS